MAFRNLKDTTILSGVLIVGGVVLKRMGDKISKKQEEDVALEVAIDSILGAENENTESIEYTQYGKRINYLEMIYNLFYDPESSIYQLKPVWTQFSDGEGYLNPEKFIFQDLKQGSSQIGGKKLTFRFGDARKKLKNNVKNAIQRASGTKLSRSGRTHGSGLISATYDYNGKRFFVLFEMSFP